MTTNSQNPETIGLHGGTFRRDESQTSVAVQYIKLLHISLILLSMQEIYLDMKEFGNIYTRIMNPTTNVL